jgi:hypothetical protein
MEKKRLRLIQGALDEIRDTRDSRDFYRKSYNMIAKYGMHLKAKECGLFEGVEWSSYEHKDALIKKIEGFLIQKIK